MAAVDITDDIVITEHTSVVFQQVWYTVDGHVHTAYSWMETLLNPGLPLPSVYEQASVAHTRNNDSNPFNDVDAIIITDHGPMLATEQDLVDKNPADEVGRIAWLRLDAACSAANVALANDPLMVPAEELGGKFGELGTGHYLAYGISSFVPSYIATDLPQDQIDRVNDANGFGFIAHPYKGDIWPGNPGEYQGFAGIELLNGNEAVAMKDTIVAWHTLMSRHMYDVSIGQPGEEGREGWVGIANSDAHHTNELGQNKNYVYLDGGLTKDNLYSSLKKGQVVASHGSMVTFTIALLNLDGEETGTATKIGETLEAKVGQKVKLHIAWDTMGSGDLEGIYMVGTLSPSLDEEEIKIKDAEKQGNIGYITYELELTGAGYLRMEARLAGDSGVAYTNPIFINVKGSSVGYSLHQETSVFVELSEVIREYVQTAESWAGAIFRADWPGSTVRLTLTNTDGLVITPDSQLPNVYHEAGPTFEFYQVTEPLPGTWTIGLEGIDVPSGEEAVDLQIWSMISTKPQAKILEPASGAKVSGLVSVSVNASDKEGISELACYVDSILLGTGINPPYEFSWDTTHVEDGAHLITVWLTDVDGNTVGDSAQVYVVNHPELSPNTPSNPSPANDVTDVFINVDVSWTGGDPDAGDTVTYDVYFGPSSSPPFRANIGPYPSTQSSITYDPGTLGCNTTYYWRIVATDDRGASTTGTL